MATTGERIRQAREARGITKAELARTAGLSAGAVSRIEHGERAPGSATLQRIALALGVSPGALLDEAPAARLVAPVAVSGVNPDGADTVAAVQLVAAVMPTLPPAGRARVLRILRAALDVGVGAVGTVGNTGIVPGG